MTAKQIAIDGPAGAGKSTIAKLVAAKLGYLYIDTGAMYRALAWLTIQAGLDFTDEKGIVQLAQRTELAFLPAQSGCQVMVDGTDISSEIRTPEVGNAASAISVLPGVRTYLVKMQQALAEHQPVVMDGRDIGTVVLPHAECKIFLTATVEVRAERRTKELLEKGIPAEMDQVKAELQERDHRDSNRAHSPLRQAEDAKWLDSSDLTIPQVVERVLHFAGALV